LVELLLFLSRESVLNMTSTPFTTVTEPMFPPVLDASERDTQKHTGGSFFDALFFCCGYELEDLLARLRADRVSARLRLPHPVYQVDTSLSSW
jgi:hypothetical protein